MSTARLPIGALAVFLSVVPATLHAQKAPLKVTVVLPTKGNLEHSCVQPGYIQAFEVVRLYVRAAGFLKSQSVDIGDRVKRGQVLAVIDAPELEAQFKLDEAGVRQTDTRSLRSKTAVRTAMAELDALKAALVQAQAKARSAAAATRARQLENERVKKLVDQKVVPMRELDESKVRYDAAVGSEQAAKAAILTAEAHIDAGASRVDEAKAEVAVTQADIDAAKVKFEISRIRLEFATITAPFDGVITQRNCFPGDLIRSSDQQGAKPLLTIERVDRMRVVVAVPELDAAFVNPGDPATLEFQAYPGKKWGTKVSRIARALDPKTRTLRVELDLANPDGRLFTGMYASVAIALAKKDVMSVPSTCVRSDILADGDVNYVYVVRDGLAQRVRVDLGMRGGERVEILRGLAFTDHVILQPAGVSEGAEVTPTAGK